MHGCMGGWIDGKQRQTDKQTGWTYGRTNRQIYNVYISRYIHVDTQTDRTLDGKVAAHTQTTK